jgi:hypothetical protein
MVADRSQPARGRAPCLTSTYRQPVGIRTLLFMFLIIATAQMYNAALGDSHAANRTSIAAPDLQPKLTQTLETIRRSKSRYVIVEAQKGLGNRLRAVASAMSVAASLGRPVVVVWVPDLHCNCSIKKLFTTRPFTLLEVPIGFDTLTVPDFQVYNYMRGEAGAHKDEPVDVDPDRHLYFKSAYMMNHPMGKWSSGGPQRCTQASHVAVLPRAYETPVARIFSHARLVATGAGNLRDYVPAQRFSACSWQTGAWLAYTSAMFSMRRVARIRM